MNRKLQRTIPIIDLFAGPGGLGEGFAASTDANGNPLFRIALSIEKDVVAHRTLTLRAFFRAFPKAEVPLEYYRFLRGQITQEDLFNQYPVQAASAQTEAWCKKLAVNAHGIVAERVRSVGAIGEESILIGGPPCQAYSLIGRARNAGNPNYQPSADERHTLYQEYLRVLVTQLPSVFVMENVKGLLSAKYEEQKLLQRIIHDLKDPLKALNLRVRTRTGERYQIFSFAEPRHQVDAFDNELDDVNRFIVKSELYGVPQRRHRVIIIGIREDMLSSNRFALRRQPLYTVEEALSDLPALRSGVSGDRDSSDKWLGIIGSAMRQNWYARLQQESDPIAAAIDRAVSLAFKKHRDRGAEYIAGSASPTRARSWFHDKRLGGFLNHSTRGHMEADLFRYLFASSFAQVRGRSPTLGSYPTQLLPKHRNIGSAVANDLFADRFRVQVRNQPSSTITAHIAKDGHYYIHHDPSQCRSLTVREAARLQTFPDNYFFCGPRTSQYAQIGNAVPPLLAQEIAIGIGKYLGVA